MPEKMKRCARCGAVKPESEFGTRGDPPRLYSHCIECRAKDRLKANALREAKLKGHRSHADLVAEAERRTREYERMRDGAHSAVRHNDR